MESKQIKVFLTTCLAMAVTAAGLMSSPGANAEDGKFALTMDYALFYGFGVAGSYNVAPKFNARAEWHPQQKFLNFSKSSSGFDVRGDGKFGYVGLFADWFPFDNQFRLSVGLGSQQGSKISATGTASRSAAANSTIVARSGGGTSVNFGGKSYGVDNNKSYTYNGTTYYAYNGGVYTAQNGGGTTILSPNSSLNDLVANASAKVDVKWPSSAIYVGLGYGNPVKASGGWNFWLDAGAFVSSKPKVTSSVSNNCTGVTNREACEVLTQELNAQADEAVEDVKKETNKLNVIPTVAVGITYTF